MTVDNYTLTLSEGQFSDNRLCMFSKFDNRFLFGDRYLIFGSSQHIIKKVISTRATAGEEHVLVEGTAHSLELHLRGKK
jgi:hypothetical protein